MIYWVTIKEYMFFFNYLNTFSGIIFWLIYVIRNKDYPIKPITLAIFLMKLVADVFALIVYNGDGNWASNAMCILLPVVDFLFIMLYVKRKKTVVAM